MNRNLTKGIWVGLSCLLICFSSVAYCDQVHKNSLFFGRTIPANQEDCEMKVNYVSDEMWDWFIANDIFKPFSKGFTVMDAAGIWNGQQEESKIILFTYTLDEDPSTLNDAIIAIAEFYAQNFCQESVMQIREDEAGNTERNFIKKK